MKSVFKFLVILAFAATIVFSMTAATCGGGGGTGSGGVKSIGGGASLTVTDIPSKYNGKYALFVAHYVTDREYAIFACQSPPLDQINVKISNGKVSLPTWYSASGSSDPYVKYSGNDATKGSGQLYIYDSAAVFFSDMKSGSSYDASITFSNGSASISMNGQQFWDMP